MITEFIRCTPESGDSQGERVLVGRHADNPWGHLDVPRGRTTRASRSISHQSWAPACRPRVVDWHLRKRKEDRHG